MKWMHNVRERVRESGSNANTEICFEVRAHSSTSLPSHRRIFTNSSTQDFPHREPPLRILGKYNLGVHCSSLNQYNLSLEARHKPTQYQSHKWGIGSKPLKHNHLTLEGFQHNLHYHLSLEGYQNNHLSLEGYHKEWKVYNSRWSQRPQTTFSH